MLVLTDEDMAELRIGLLPDMRVKEANMLMGFLNERQMRAQRAKDAAAEAHASARATANGHDAPHSE